MTTAPRGPDGPRSERPLRRSFTPAQKLEHLAAYEAACQTSQGGAYLRSAGLFSTQITEWRKLRDTGVLTGKQPGERVGKPSARDALMTTYAQLTQAGVTTRAAATMTGVPRSTATRRRPDLTPPAARPAPVNRLSAAERLHILAVLDAPRFVDLPPVQVYATLLDEGTYLCSISTMYRVLAEHAQLVERRRIARHPARTVPELVATGPGQVYSWDITKLAGPTKGCYYDAYVMIDIYSRYIVGVKVHPSESGPLAVEMMRQVFGLHGTPQVVHADRGTSMTSKSVAQLLADLEVTRSHSRPKVSNDNPYSEAWFKTLKYAPAFPERFGCLADAQQYLQAFVEGYNHHHRHTSIGLHTPADVHYGHASTVDADREATLAQARARHPERFATTRSPKILHRPDVAWINQPQDEAA